MNIDHSNESWLAAVTDTFASYRRMIDAAVKQLSNEQLRIRLQPGVNSVAVILRHLAGNLKSRWTEIFTTDGEKPDRDRDSEFQDWEGDRESLERYFNEGWAVFEAILRGLSHDDFARKVVIRGEAQTLQEALLGALTHVSYHVGQIMMIARTVHEGEWKWLTIAPNESAKHNSETWGTSMSRGIAGDDGEKR